MRHFTASVNLFNLLFCIFGLNDPVILFCFNLFRPIADYVMLTEGRSARDLLSSSEEWHLSSEEQKKKKDKFVRQCPEGPQYTSHFEYYLYVAVVGVCRCEERR